MTAPTPEQRAGWRADAAESIRLPDSSWDLEYGHRILALLDALDAAEAKVARILDGDDLFAAIEALMPTAHGIHARVAARDVVHAVRDALLADDTTDA